MICLIRVGVRLDWRSCRRLRSVRAVRCLQRCRAVKRLDELGDASRHSTAAVSSGVPGWPLQATKSTFELDQAVVRFRLNEDWALITRTKLPGIVEPPKKHGEH